MGIKKKKTNAYPFPRVRCTWKKNTPRRTRDRSGTRSFHRPGVWREYRVTAELNNQSYKTKRAYEKPHQKAYTTRTDHGPDHLQYQVHPTFAVTRWCAGSAHSEQHIQPKRSTLLMEHADLTAPTRRHKLDHEDLPPKIYIITGGSVICPTCQSLPPSGSLSGPPRSWIPGAPCPGPARRRSYSSSACAWAGCPRLPVGGTPPRPISTPSEKKRKSKTKQNAYEVWY